MSFILGVDLGQAVDYSAIAVIEPMGQKLHLRHAERIKLGITYNEIVDRIEALCQTLVGCHLVVDATGVGRAVIDLLRERGLDPVPVTLTGGRTTRCTDGAYTVPKRELVRVLATALENDKLKVARDIPVVGALLDELANYAVTINARGHDSYHAARGHDDLVTAAGLAVFGAIWLGRHRVVPRKRKLRHQGVNS